MVRSGFTGLRIDERSSRPPSSPLPVEPPRRPSLFALTSARARCCPSSSAPCQYHLHESRHINHPKFTCQYLFYFEYIKQTLRFVRQLIEKHCTNVPEDLRRERGIHVSLGYALLLRGRRALIVCIVQFKQLPHSCCQRSFCKSQLRFHLSTFTHGNFCSSYNKLCRGMLLKNCTLHGTLYNSFALCVTERGKEGSERWLRVL